MIISCGISMFENERLAQAHRKYGDALLHRLFTREELEYAVGSVHMIQRLGARFAAKCACFQAVHWDTWRAYLQISVTKDNLGAPGLQLTSDVLKKFKAMGATDIHLSITHIETFSMAQVMIEKR